MSNKRLIRYMVMALLMVLLVAIKILKVDYYKVSSTSMLPTLSPDDLILIKSPTIIHRGDIVVFNKPIWGHCENDSAFFGPEYVKRCYGLPGDTVLIHRPELVTGYQSRVKEKYSTYIFPQDTSFRWTKCQMGPLWVPRRNKTVILDSSALTLYRTILLFEGHPAGPKQAPGKPENYTFKYDYYFFVGDNFYESEDSRNWGFVPSKSLIGKVFFKL